MSDAGKFMFPNVTILVRISGRETNNGLGSHTTLVRSSNMYTIAKVIISCSPSCSPIEMTHHHSLDDQAQQSHCHSRTDEHGQSEKL